MEDLRELGIECLQLDVTKTDNINQIRDKVAELTGGTLNILVNNAYALLIGFIFASDYSIVAEVCNLLMGQPFDIHILHLSQVIHFPSQM
jgi:NAD(P)-dependent dehydrogenase (short-subunit alcohol dehydrogenase family)